jgi:hypothetical protein
MTSERPEWIAQAKTRGLTGALRMALDVLEPLGALGAQALWVAQPVLGLWLPRQAVRELAEALEAPGGIERLRAFLDE